MRRFPLGFLLLRMPTPLISASLGNTDVLELILEDENCDVDPINRLEGATPLHLALKLKDPDVRYETCWHLLDAGADPTYAIIPSPLAYSLD